MSTRAAAFKESDLRRALKCANAEGFSKVVYKLQDGTEIRFEQGHAERRSKRSK
jgi:hypothetical protein